MKKSKQEKLKKAGWRVGSVEEFLDLTAEEAAFIEMKLALAESVRERRLKKKLTQTQLAKLLESSQSRVAKMESADESVSLDLLVRSLLALGATRKEVAKILATPSSKAA